MDLGDGKKGLSRDYIIQAAEASLKRLQTDHIDLYQSHTDDQTVPLEETLSAYRALIEQGKVTIIGASNYKAPRLREAIDIAKRESLPTYQTLQPQYNLYDRQDFEQNLQPVAQELGLGVIPYFSLASGFLTGKYKSKADTEGKNRGSRVTKYFDDRGMKILKALDQVSAETGAAQATISLAWLLAQPTILAPSPQPPAPASSRPCSPPPTSPSPKPNSKPSPRPAPTNSLRRRSNRVQHRVPHLRSQPFASGDGRHPSSPDNRARRGRGGQTAQLQPCRKAPPSIDHPKRSPQPHRGTPIKDYAPYIPKLPHLPCRRV